MATTYNTAKTADSVTRRLGLGLVSVTAEFDMAGSIALAVNDVIEMVKVPKGVTVLDVTISSDDLDTGSPAIVLDVGDGDDTARFIDGSTIAQGGGVSRLTEHAGHGYEYLTDDTIDIHIETVAATPTTVGTLACTVLYTNDA